MKIGRYELKRYEDEEKESTQADEIKVDKPYKLVTRVDSPLYEGYNFGKYNPDQLYRKKGGFRIFDEMRTDDQINAVLNLIKYIILGSAWDIECEDNEEIPEFIKKNLNEQLDEIFIKKLYNILSAIDYGFSLTEKVFSEQDGKIILKSLKTRSPHSFDIEQDVYGKITNIVQHVTNGDIDIDPSKFIHYAYQEEFDNPYGKSALNMGVYRAYWSKNNIIKFMNIYLERHGMPFGVATYPKGTSQAAIEDLKKVGKNIQAKSFMVAPEGVVVDFKEAQKGTDVFERAIDQYNTSIARSMLLPDLLGLSGSKTGGGSYALGDKQFEIFYQTVDFERKKLERLITDEIVKPLVQWNFGNDIEVKFSFTPVDKTEKRELLKIWLDAAKSGKIPITNDHINWFLQNVEAPEISEEDLNKIEEEKSAMAEQIQGNTNENQEPKQTQKEDEKKQPVMDKEVEKKPAGGTKKFSDNRRTIEKNYYNENHDESGRFASGEEGDNYKSIENELWGDLKSDEQIIGRKDISGDTFDKINNIANNNPGMEDSIENWRTGGYKNINNYLRETEFEGNEFKIKNDINNLDKYIDNFSNDGEETFYRGMKIKGSDIEKFEKDSIFEDKGYNSFSSIIGSAENFSGSITPIEKRNSVPLVMKYTTQKGDKIAPILSYNYIKKSFDLYGSGEKEFLVERNSKYKITNQKIENNVVYIEVEKIKNE